MTQHLATKGLLEAFAHQVRLVRGRFGAYEPIDFLALLIGYAISGERTLADFFERLAPFEAAFMALFGSRSLPHRSSLSHFLADVDRPCLEAFRTLFEKHSFADGWTSESTRARGLPGSVHIDDEPLLPHPVPQAPSRIERGSRSQIHLKERSQRFHRRLIKSGKEVREG